MHPTEPDNDDTPAPSRQQLTAAHNGLYQTAQQHPQVASHGPTGMLWLCNDAGAILRHTIDKEQLRINAREFQFVPSMTCLWGGHLARQHCHVHASALAAYVWCTISRVPCDFQQGRWRGGLSSVSCWHHLSQRNPPSNKTQFGHMRRFCRASAWRCSQRWSPRVPCPRSQDEGSVSVVSNSCLIVGKLPVPLCQ